jgi:hypothetical protein
VEVGAGVRWEEALSVARALPDSEVVLTDADARVLEAPAPLRGVVDDLLRPSLAVYRGAALVYGVRLPEDLHAPAALVAGSVGADLALRLLGDEAPALPRAPAARFADEGGTWQLWPAARSRP